MKKTAQTIFLNFFLLCLILVIGCTNSKNRSFQQVQQTADAAEPKVTKAEEPTESPIEKLPLPNEELYKDWESVYVKNTCNFDIPPTMEVKAGRYREFIVDDVNSKGYDTSQLTVQQAGLNDMNPDAFEKYARVMFVTTFGNSGDYERLNFNTSKFTDKELFELNEQMKSQTVQGFYGTDLKLTEWLATDLETINGMSCMHISYTRQFQNNPIVQVDIYTFPNNDRVHDLTLSYRVRDAYYWINDYTTILNSFRITSVM